MPLTGDLEVFLGRQVTAMMARIFSSLGRRSFNTFSEVMPAIRMLDKERERDREITWWAG